MAFIDRKEQQAAGPRGFDIKDEGFSEEYRSFLTRRCRAQIGTDGIYRNSQGARYCSCDMCGKVATTDMQGKLYCDYHFEYRCNPFEENICTVEMHKLRPLIVIEGSFSRRGVIAPDDASIKPYAEMYADACNRLGVRQPKPGESMYRHICSLIDERVQAAKHKAQKTADRRREGVDKSRDVEAQLRKLQNNLAMSRPISVNFRKAETTQDPGDDFPL